MSTLILFLCLWTALHSSPAAAKTLPHTYQAQVIEVVDGDSVWVEILLWFRQKKTVSIRVLGVDTPEIRGKCPSEKQAAQRAKQFVADLLPSGTSVVLQSVQEDPYPGRAVAQVLIDVDNVLTDLALLLIKEELGRPYGTGRKSWCAKTKEGDK